MLYDYWHELVGFLLWLPSTGHLYFDCFAENSWRAAGTETLCRHCYWLLRHYICVGSSFQVKGDWPAELRSWGNKQALYQYCLPGFFACALHFSFFSKLWTEYYQLPMRLVLSKVIHSLKVTLLVFLTDVRQKKDQLLSGVWMHPAKLSLRKLQVHCLIWRVLLQVSSSCHVLLLHVWD